MSGLHRRDDHRLQLGSYVDQVDLIAYAATKLPSWFAPRRTCGVCGSSWETCMAAGRASLRHTAAYASGSVYFH